VKSEQVVDLYGDFAKKFRFRIPLHPKNLQQLIHPHFGYLGGWKDRAFTFEEIMTVTRNQLVSTYERSLGQEILGDELSCLSFWLLQDSEKKGYFNLQEAKPLIEALKFDINPFTLNNFKKEFRFTLN
jgi:hypothetical protein